MNKLTAEKCRQFIISMKSEQDRNQLSITGEYQLQALEIALPILEQQERGCQKCGGTGMADSGGTQPWGEQILIECDCKFEQHERGEGGWIEWGGGECPVDVNQAVEVRLMDGTVSSALPTDGWVWEHGLLSPGADIIAYRIIPERATNQNGEQ